MTVPIDKTISIKGAYKISDLLELSGLYDYDIDEEQGTRTEYAAIYSPLNDCWKLSVNYMRSLIEKDDKRISLNFLVNFNQNNFTSLSGN